MTVYLYFWFDVEDYVTPESDTALGRLIDIFDRHGLRATFKMVGEKVRALERRGHYDILRGLRDHDIGYHTDYHSRPPSISEYALQCDWSGGIAEFERRERGGVGTLRRTFGQLPSCYGQPGGAWAPHVYPVLRQWGIPVYLDAGPWVSVRGRPHYYCGTLNLLGLENTMHIGIGRGAAEVERCQETLGEIVRQLRPTGGEVSLYAHECEFVTSQFWDAVNYDRGRDTARDQWQPAPTVSVEESESRYAAMDRFLEYAQSLEEIEVVVASQAPSLYPDNAQSRSFTCQQVAGMCRETGRAVRHRLCDGVWLSPAEQFCLVVAALAGWVGQGSWPAPLPCQYVDGPIEASQSHVVSPELSLDDILGTCLYEDARMRLDRRMPAQVQVGRNWLSPADYLATVAAAFPRWLAGDKSPAQVLRGDLEQAAYVPQHVAWDWRIFPPNFDGDALLELGRLQSWTIKPASQIS